MVCITQQTTYALTSVRLDRGNDYTLKYNVYCQMSLQTRVTYRGSATIGAGGHYPPTLKRCGGRRSKYIAFYLTVNINVNFPSWGEVSY